MPRPSASCAVHVSAPAKINLYLEILGKRPDGYHELETLLLAVELFDDLTFEPTEADQITLNCDEPALTCGPDNLVMKAARLLKEKTGCPNGAAIRLVKRIPWAAGLGGGSSDAAATLAGLNELWELGLATEQLKSLGAELGSDVPFFFHAPAAWCTGRGEVVKPVKVGRAFDLVLVKPTVGLNTADVYREFSGGSPQSEIPTPQSVFEALATGDVETLGRSLHNRLQEAAMRLSPPVEKLYRRLQALDAAGCLLSGSGSSLFALCRDQREAERVGNDLLRGLSPDDELAGARVFCLRSCQ